MQDKNFTRLCNTKSALVVNGSIPGPVVYVNKGDTIFVNVYNQGSAKVTIHWYVYRIIAKIILNLSSEYIVRIYN